LSFFAVRKKKLIELLVLLVLLVLVAFPLVLLFNWPDGLLLLLLLLGVVAVQAGS
jgi:hypothetical protein